MVMLTRLLPRRLLTLLFAVRTTRAQARQSDDLGMLALVLAVVVALRTFRQERARQRREGRVTHSTLTEYLDR